MTSGTAAEAAPPTTGDADMEDSFDLDSAIRELQSHPGHWPGLPSPPSSPARVETQLLREASATLEARRGLIEMTFCCIPHAERAATNHTDTRVGR